MPKKINFIIKQGIVEKKIFKLFSDKVGDLYFSFNYFNSMQYNCGIGYFPVGVEELTFNPIANGNGSRIPVKLSYHSDGRIHFKPIKSSTFDLPPSYKLAKLRSTPLAKLSSQHILTIEIEGLVNFDNIYPVRKDEIYVFYEVPYDAKRFKFAFYGGMKDSDKHGTFKRCHFISLHSPRLPNPLILALDFVPFKDSTIKEGPQQSLICIAGFKLFERDSHLNKQFIYLNAR